MRATMKWVAACGRLGALALVATVLVGCANRPVRIDYATYDHLTTSTGERLYRVRATEIGALYLKPGVWFADYGSVAFQPVTLAYQGAPRMPSVFDRKPGNFLLRLDASDRLEHDLSEALATELARNGNLSVVSEPTPETLMISPQIVRLRWETPPEQGGESLYVSRTGVMTLILDLRDARTGALLARIADAQSIRPADVGLSGAYQNSPVNNWAGVRDVCTHWAWVLRGTLETLHNMPAMRVY